jgi:hypothetical protein
MKTKTHLSHVAEQRGTVEDVIRSLIGLSEMDHKQMIYEFGLTFLHLTYTDPEFGKDIRAFERSALFWKWWRMEYYQWEQDYLRFLNDSGHSPCFEHYYNEMLPVLQDGKTLDSFLMFLKIFANKRA